MLHYKIAKTKKIFTKYTAVILALSFGIFCGWVLRDYIQLIEMEKERAREVLRILVNSHSIYSSNSKPRVEFAPDNFTVFSNKMKNTFGIRMQVPKFDDDNYQYLGSRVIPLQDKVAGIMFFDCKSTICSMFILPNLNMLDTITHEVFYEKQEKKIFFSDHKSYASILLGNMSEIDHNFLIDNYFSQLQTQKRSDYR